MSQLASRKSFEGEPKDTFATSANWAKGMSRWTGGLGDYRFNDHLGIRAGKVKTVLGLYNDTQDVEFLHTWALLPQSLYPLDLRGLTISHIGADVYGAVSPRRLGTFSYTAHVGILPADRAGGNQYALAAFGQYVRTTSGTSQGLDVKWTTPLEGLLLGAAFVDSPQHLGGDNLAAGGAFHSDTTEHTTVLSAQYTHGPFRVEYERSRLTSLSSVLTPYGVFGPPEIIVPLDVRGWYAAAAFRISKRVELGAYHSRFYPNDNRQVAYQSYLDWPARHIFDQAFTARFDIKSYLDLKVEGHLMDGYGDPETSRGFYPQNNPNGLKPKTNLLVVRLGLNF
jgi:hypothetical protein